MRESALDIPVPHLVTASSGPLYHLEEVMLKEVAKIEAWLRAQWKISPAPITTSVDLRNAGFKLAPVDTNLFPAGFNNLNPEGLPLCIQAAQSALSEGQPGCTKILIIPESHTRNRFYAQSLKGLQDIFSKAGFIVRIGSLEPSIAQPFDLMLDDGGSVSIEPVCKVGNRLVLENYDPCVIILNNDLSSGTPDLLKNVEQPILPKAELGWSNRFKSDHFKCFSQVANEFSRLIDVDSWLINPMFTHIDGLDFMAKEGIERLAEACDRLLCQIKEKYQQYSIQQKPYVAVKSDSGTYGMSVMMVQDGQDILSLNRKQRTKMSASKGSRSVSRVIIQEGVHTFETMPDGSVAEPVVYMIGQYVVGGFYRIHQGRGKSDNLNAPGMHFQPLAFAGACNYPREDLDVIESPNRFYVYGVIARLAALAAAKEAAIADSNKE